MNTSQGGRGRSATRLILLDKFLADDAVPGVVGAKAANLMLMSDTGLPVPPGFTLTTDICADCAADGDELGSRTRELIRSGVRHIEEVTGRGFGSGRRPLLLSVRSGAPVSMPGMMDTFLDVGLSERTVPGLIRATGDPVFVWDSYRRLVAQFAELVANCPVAALEEAVVAVMDRHGIAERTELDVAALQDLVEHLLQMFQAGSGRPFPEPDDQLTDAVQAVVRSWRSERAVAYRRLQGLPDTLGTAVTVQAMVFGNLGIRSGSGVGFTRDPSSGEDRLYVDFLLNAQGEDVVAGRIRATDAGAAIASVPGLERELEAIRRTLEAAFGDAQDFEFTVEEGKLWMLQSRPAKRTPLAALRIACDLVEAGVIDPATALQRLSGYDLGSIRRTVSVRPAGTRALARATPASAGVASGRVALDVSTAAALAGGSAGVILVRPHATTEDVAALAVCRGVLTASGARTSHAAVVARQLDVVCLVGCRSLVFDPGGRSVRIGSRVFAEGEVITLDGNSGEVYAGELQLVEEPPTELLDRVRRWRSRDGAGTVAG